MYIFSCRAQRRSGVSLQGVRARQARNSSSTVRVRDQTRLCYVLSAVVVERGAASGLGSPTRADMAFFTKIVHRTGCTRVGTCLCVTVTERARVIAWNKVNADVMKQRSWHRNDLMRTPVAQAPFPKRCTMLISWDLKKTLPFTRVLHFLR